MLVPAYYRPSASTTPTPALRFRWGIALTRDGQTIELEVFTATEDYEAARALLQDSALGLAADLEHWARQVEPHCYRIAEGAVCPREELPHR